MRFDSMVGRPASRRPAALALPLLLSAALATGAGAQADPRVGLGAGWTNAKEAARGMELVTHLAKPERFFNTAEMGDFNFANADMAFRGNLLFLGGYNGFQVWDL